MWCRHHEDRKTSTMGLRGCPYHSTLPWRKRYLGYPSSKFWGGIYEHERMSLHQERRKDQKVREGDRWSPIKSLKSEVRYWVVFQREITYVRRNWGPRASVFAPKTAIHESYLLSWHPAYRIIQLRFSEPISNRFSPISFSSNSITRSDQLPRSHSLVSIPNVTAVVLPA